MSAVPMKCLILLSSKSSGSSALQNTLTRLPQVNCVRETHHYQSETLFWAKAASVLGMPQVDMLDSEVPIPRDKAKYELIHLLRNNLRSYTAPDDDSKLAFEGWVSLCERFAPVFFEKSPHHLHQWSALELMRQCMEIYSGKIDFLFVGLVRNPMDTIYSRWRKGGSIPEKYQYEWFTAYSNLLKFKALLNDKLVLIRYEDMVVDPPTLDPIYEFIGAPSANSASRSLHRRSIKKWREDKYYGFQLAAEVLQLGERYGYRRSEMTNSTSALWPLYKHAVRAAHQTLHLAYGGPQKLRHEFERIVKTTFRAS
jgi:hypothetical protein